MPKGRWKKGRRQHFTDRQYKEMTDAYATTKSFRGASKLLKSKYTDKAISTEMERRGDYVPIGRPAKADVDMAMAVLAAEAGNYERTAAATGFDVKTIKAWEAFVQKEAAKGEKHPTIEKSKQTLAERLDVIVEKATNAIEKRIRQATLRDLTHATKELMLIRERLVGLGGNAVPKDMSREERLRAIATLIGSTRGRTAASTLSLAPPPAAEETSEAEDQSSAA